MIIRDKADHLYQQQINMNENIQFNSEEQLIKKAVLHLNGHIFGCVLGIISALVIFVATNWLVIKGGDVIGPHLGLLSHFFIGYSVTFVGSLIGAVYGFVISYLSGLIIGWVYNGVVSLRTRKIRG